MQPRVHYWKSNLIFNIDLNQPFLLYFISFAFASFWFVILTFLIADIAGSTYCSCGIRNLARLGGEPFVILWIEPLHLPFVFQAGRVAPFWDFSNLSWNCRVEGLKVLQAYSLWCLNKGWRVFDSFNLIYFVVLPSPNTFQKVLSISALVRSTS